MADVNQRDDVPEEQTREQILRYGHKGILTMNTGSQMENITTLKAAFAPPKSPGVRLRGIRSELLERRIAQIINFMIIKVSRPSATGVKITSGFRV
ncbi:sperm associated antigen 8 isoform X2 [Phyllopteryx taeniolatus]|uniref:sperm associated antigen 8 isoform X2 n=1 Tax=Phyllopteryx taeniolatus TaxID=161469 RepID=UPI002AD41014|nr:sperm associated antigen 8 isoform X2 [Phyllopteryx taeniolatus]